MVCMYAHLKDIDSYYERTRDHMIDIQTRFELFEQSFLLHDQLSAVVPSPTCKLLIDCKKSCSRLSNLKW